MSFGKYSMEQSRRFYFASDTSYILLELMLPHGPHVIGVAGRGPGGGFGHQFFAYAGELSLTTTRRTVPACASASCSPTSSAKASRPTR